MILFYNKKTGKIIGHIDGRVHDPAEMKMSIINRETGIEDVGKYLIGWELIEEVEDYEVETEGMEEVEGGLFKKVMITETRQRRKRIEHNLDKFEILERFEGDNPENPTDYKIDIETNNLIKK